MLAVLYQQGCGFTGVPYSTANAKNSDADLIKGKLGCQDFAKFGLCSVCFSLEVCSSFALTLPSVLPCVFASASVWSTLSISLHRYIWPTGIFYSSHFLCSQIAHTADHAGRFLISFTWIWSKTKPLASLICLHLCWHQIHCKRSIAHECSTVRHSLFLSPCEIPCTSHEARCNV